MEFENILIKIEPEDKIMSKADDSKVFGWDISQNCINADNKSLVEFSQTNFKSITSSNCKRGPDYSSENEKYAFKSPKKEIEDSFDKEDLVDISKLNQLVNHGSNIKPEDKEFDTKSFIVKEEDTKLEKEECDISEEKPQLYDSSNFTLQESLQNLQEFSANSDFDEKTEIDNEKITFASTQSSDDHLISQQVMEKKSKIHKCLICSFQTQKKSYLTYHINSKHTDDQRTRISCQFCDKTFLLQQSLNYHLLKEHGDKTYLTKRTIHRCNICSYHAQFKSTLDRHVNTVHNGLKLKKNCQFCDKSYTTQSALNNHWLKIHNVEVNDKMYKCEDCAYISTKQSCLSKHIISYHVQRSKKICQFCEKSFWRKDSLDDHLLKNHEDEIKSDISLITSTIRTCKVCNYRTTVKTILDKHIISKHNAPKIYNCQYCKESFTLPGLLDEHILKQHKEKACLTKSEVYQCTICSFQTTFKSILDKHVNTMHNEERPRITCQFCRKSFSLQESLDNHLLKQHEEEIKNDISHYVTNRIHTCNLCSYKTTIKNNLEKHIISNHNTEKINICQFCNKSFVRKYSLNHHLLRLHQDKMSSINSKIHKCDICSYQTTIKYSFDKHKLAHIKQKRVNCQFCDKLFTEKRSCDDHMLKKHKEQIKSNMEDFISNPVLTCSICSYKTTRKDYLRLHLIRIHKKPKNQFISNKNKSQHQENT